MTRIKSKRRPPARLPMDVVRKCATCPKMIPVASKMRTCYSCEAERMKLNAKYRRVTQYRCGGCGHAVIVSPCLICAGRKQRELDAARQD